MSSLSSRLTRILQNAIRIHLLGRPAVSNVRPLPSMGRARVPLSNMPRVREIDGPTIRLPRPGEPGVNNGAGYRPRPGVARRRWADVNEARPAFREVA